MENGRAAYPENVFIHLNLIFQHKIDCVLHLAGLKAVRESHSQPFQYYKVNVIGSINLFEVGLFFFSGGYFMKIYLHQSSK